MGSDIQSSAAGALIKGMMRICSRISEKLNGQVLDAMTARSLIVQIDDLLPLLGSSEPPHRSLVPAMEAMWCLRVELTDIMQSGSTGPHEQVSRELARLEELLLRK